MRNLINKIERIGKKMQDQKISLESTIKESGRKRVTDKQCESGVDHLIYNHTISKSGLCQFFGGSKVTVVDRINKAISEGVIAEPIYQNKSHLFTRHQVATLMSHWGCKTYRDDHDPIAISVQNHKGGTGKSSTSVSIAVKSALDMHLNARVCLVDLDPQGSAARGLITPSDNQVYLTVCDLLLDKDEPNTTLNELLNAGYDMETIIKETPFKTHLPNLDVITAFPTDERFTDSYWKSDGQSVDDLLTRFDKQVMPTLKQCYDIIIMDLPPADGPIVWSANEATDAILVPISPRTYDFVSTTNYMLTLSDRLRSLPSKGEKLRWLKMLIVNHDTKSESEKATIERLQRSVTDSLMLNSIKHSEAFPVAALRNRSVLDIAKTEKVCTDKQLRVALDSVEAVYEQFIDEIKTVAAKT